MNTQDKKRNDAFEIKGNIYTLILLQQTYI